MSHNPDRYRELVAPAVVGLSGLVDGTLLLIERRKLPDADSAAMRELAQEDSFALHARAATPITDAITSSGQYLAAGCDHIRSMCSLYQADPAVLFSDRVLLRAAIEACSRAAWLSESVGPGERARRILNERLASMDDQLELLTHSGADRDGVFAAFKDLRLELARSYESAGLGEVGRKDGRVWVQPKRPGPSGVIKLFADEIASDVAVKDAGRVLQGLYSGFTHSSLWALMSGVKTDATLPPDARHLPGRPSPRWRPAQRRLYGRSASPGPSSPSPWSGIGPTWDGTTRSGPTRVGPLRRHSIGTSSDVLSGPRCDTSGPRVHPYPRSGGCWGMTPRCRGTTRILGTPRVSVGPWAGLRV